MPEAAATVVLDGSTLTLDQVVAVARGGARVELAPAALDAIRAARATVERALAGGAAIYGLTTGVGARKAVVVPDGDQVDYNRRLILNHRTAQGPPCADELVRAAMLRLANGFARGLAGVRPELAARLVDALNDGRRPQVRSLGSVGEADLPQLADLARELFGDEPLGPKEALALVSSNAFSTGAAALAVADAARLLDALDAAGALDLEAWGANLSIIDPVVVEARPFPGLRATVARLAELLAGSRLWQDGAARNLQDPLTFRCLPQVHGAARDALAYAERQLALELNASQENPLVADGRIVSAGNFDVLPLAAALDFLRIALAPALTSACERLLKLLHSGLSGLPLGLAVRDGLVEDSIAEFGVPAQALTAEARLLAQPVSFELASSSHAEGIEDRMTLAPLAARRLAEQVALGERVVAIELVVAAQAADLRGEGPLGAGTARVRELVRGLVPFCGENEPLPQDLEPVVELVRSGLLP